MSRPPVIPVILLTGFLGAGKTTFLNKLLSQSHMRDAMVLVNEIGEVAIDHLLVTESRDDVLLLSSGCLCCSVRGELVSALEDILRALDNKRIPHFSSLILETTGLASPSEVIRTFLTHPYFAMRFAISHVITLVDAVNGLKTLENHKEAENQVAVADIIAFSKTDLMPISDDLRARLLKLNPHAKQVLTSALLEHGLGVGGADFSYALGVQAAPHDDRIQTFSLITDKALSLAALTMFLDLLRAQHGDKLLRVKGLVKIKEQPQTPLVIHGAQHILHPVSHLPAWENGDDRSRLLFITDGLDKAIVEGLFNAFLGIPQVGMADAEALSNNPLKI
jgi:G3E family GTPase